MIIHRNSLSKQELIKAIIDLKSKVDEASKQLDIRNEDDLVGFKANITRKEKKKEKKNSKTSGKKSKENEAKPVKKRTKGVSRYSELQFVSSSSGESSKIEADKNNQQIIERVPVQAPNKESTIEDPSREFANLLDEMVKREVYGIPDPDSMIKIEE